MTKPQHAIEISNLSKSYGNQVALENLSLTIGAGEIFGLIGPNGAGKTTTIRTILTLLAPTSGRVSVWGFDTVQNPRDVRQVLGYVPQEKAVDRYLTGTEHLELVASLYHLSKADADQRIKQILALVDLSGKADELVTNYSGGMKKKLDIACGLIGNPKVLVMDEPTLGLDVESRIRIWDYVRRLKKDGLTILMTTNYLDEAENLCDRIAILDRGRLVAAGRPDDLKRALGGDRILIEIGSGRNGLVEIAEKIKAELDFVRDVRLVLDRAALEFRVSSHEEAIAPIIQRLHANQLTIQAITYARPTLEDVFVTHAGREVREKGALS